MDEQEVMDVMRKYFNKMREDYKKILNRLKFLLDPKEYPVKIIERHREAGPDFIINGIAVEIKGSKLRIKGVIDQIIKYSYEYPEVRLVVPIEGLTFGLLSHLELLSSIMPNSFSYIYLVYKVNNRYLVKKYHIFDLKHKIAEGLRKLLPSYIRRKEFSIDIIDKKIQEILQKDIFKKSCKIILERIHEEAK